MTHDLMSGETIDVAVIGGGPAGLAAATELKRRGVARVVVVEREPVAGGIPRHCGHPPFGWREFRRVLTGPKYAEKLVKAALKAGVEIHTGTTVVSVNAGPELLLSTSAGSCTITPRKGIYATGVRELPRSARLLSGARCAGILNTGALQSLVYLEARRPFLRPVIIGSELVSFSAIQTCRHAGIRPVAMIEEGSRTIARRPSGLLPRMIGIPLHLRTRVTRIIGTDHVTAVEVADAQGRRREIACDGVLLTGKFTPESSLARLGHLQVDPASGGPVIDQFGRCSDPDFFATGNVLRPVETAGWSWQEGRETGARVARDLRANLPEETRAVPVVIGDPMIKLVVPQRISLPLDGAGAMQIQVRFSRQAKGFLTLDADGKTVWSKPVSALPERRYLIPLESYFAEQTGVFSVGFSDAQEA